MPEEYLISYERVDTSKDGASNAFFILAGGLIISGIIGVFRAVGFVPFALSVVAITAGIITYIYLFRCAAQTNYFRYFWTDEHGIHHVENSDPNSRVSRFEWTEIANIELINPEVEEITGIKVYLKHLKMRDVPIYLFMNSSDAVLAVKVIEDYLSILKSQGINSPTPMSNPDTNQVR